MLGQSNTGAGVFGDSNAAGGYGVFGHSTRGAAIFGVTTNGYAGSFTGPVVVQGSFTVSRGPKSAAVPDPLKRAAPPIKPPARFTPGE